MGEHVRSVCSTLDSPNWYAGHAVSDSRALWGSIRSVCTYLARIQTHCPVPVSAGPTDRVSSAPFWVYQR